MNDQHESERTQQPVRDRTARERERAVMGGTVRSLLNGLSSPHAMGEALVFASIFLQHTMRRVKKQPTRCSPRDAAHEMAAQNLLP